jgi:hypothetical protein
MSYEISDDEDKYEREREEEYDRSTKGFSLMCMLIHEAGWRIHYHTLSHITTLPPSCRMYWQHDYLPGISYCVIHDSELLAMVLIEILHMTDNYVTMALTMYMIEQANRSNAVLH